MTTEERDLCMDLVSGPFRPKGRISKEEFLRRFPSAVEQGRLAARLLEEACKNRNADDLRCAFVIGFKFGFSPEQLDSLPPLLDADWHYDHEDIVSILDDLRSPALVDALYRATQWVPKYLDFDDTRALAGKAIWALGNIGNDEAKERLRAVAHSGDPVLREDAEYQLKRLGEAT